jgi:hypothetical protein
MKVRYIAAVVGLSAMLGTGAFAQGGAGLVNVSINNVANDIARNLSVDVNRIPVTVQAPIAVAAAVCGVTVGVLSTVVPGAPAPSCTATTTNPALNAIVQRQLG